MRLARSIASLLIVTASVAVSALEEVGEGELRVGDRVRVVNGRAYRE